MKCFIYCLIIGPTKIGFYFKHREWWLFTNMLFAVNMEANVGHIHWFNEKSSETLSTWKWLIMYPVFMHKPVQRGLKNENAKKRLKYLGNWFDKFVCNHYLGNWFEKYNLCVTIILVTDLINLCVIIILVTDLINLCVIIILVTDLKNIICV